MNTANNGTITLNDKVTGVTGYNVNITGNGKLNLYNQLENADVSVTDTNVNMADGNSTTYTFNSVNSDASAGYTIDVDMDGNTSDVIATTNASNGVITIEFINYITSNGETQKFQILQTQDGNLQLALGDALASQVVEDSLSKLTDNVTNADNFDQLAGISLGTTTTINDSIIIQQAKDYDTLQLINTRESTGERKFDFVNGDTYVVSQNLGTTTSGTLSINGLDTGSTINANNHTMFNLANETTLNLNNVTVDKAKDYVVNASNANAEVNLTNTSITNTNGNAIVSNANVNLTNSSITGTTGNAIVMSNADVNLTNTSITNNQGTGVISNANVNITADAKNVEFTGNTTAVNMQNAGKTLTLNTANNGTITVNDKITGAAGYNVNITGEGTLNLYNQLEYADVTAAGTTINLANDINTIYVFNTLHSDASAKYTLDVNLDSGEADRITSTNASTGTITISSINFINGKTVSDSDIKIQIIQNTNPSSDLQLAFGDNVNVPVVVDTLATLSNTVSNTDNFDQEAGFMLATTNTLNDSIQYLTARDFDTLQLINIKESTDERNFNFVDDSTYTVTQDVGTTAAGTLNINGQSGGSNINANGHTMFNLANETTLNLNNVTVDRATDYVINASNANAEVNLTNTSITNTTGTGVIANTNINVKADGADVEFSGNSDAAINIQDAEKVLTLETIHSGKIVLNDIITGSLGYNVNITGDNTGSVAINNAIENANINIANTTIDFMNDKTENHEFLSINTGENAKLSIDLDLTNQISDVITTTDVSSGTIYLSNLNFSGSEADPSQPATFHIINNTNAGSDLQLALGDNIKIIGTLDPDTPWVDNILEFVSGTVYSNEIYTQEGGISLGTTNTYHDSVTIQKDKIYDDPLALVNGKEFSGDRNFVFTDDNPYIAKGDLLTTAEGTLNIIGNDTGSVLDADEHKLFDLKNDTTLNITNTTIENAKDYAISADNSDANVNLINSSIKNTDGVAITTNTNINITANNGKSEFSGNDDAIKITNSDKTITMNSVNNGEIILDNKIKGINGYEVVLKGDDTSKIVIKDHIVNADISLNDTNLYLDKEYLFNTAQSFTLNSGNINLNNDFVGTMHVPTLNLNGTTNLSLDVDLANESMDRITADNYYIAPDAFLNVKNLNLISVSDKTSLQILFADEALANNVKYSGDSPLLYTGTDVSFTPLYSPIYKYNVSYGVDDNDKLGYFFFNRAVSSNSSDSFNPAVLVSPIVTQAGAYTTQLQTFNYAFQHADTFMNIPYLERVSMINAGKYAMSPTGDATDVGTFSPLLTKEEDAGFWVKPYASFENIPLKNGPKVSNINYGTLIGYDSKLTEVSHGFERVITGYIGYNGASQRYQGVDAYQNGGLIGGTATFYKGNFFNATTLSVGATAGDASTMYGSENYTMLLAGIGNKTGYNFEFWDGKMILQPNFLISYTFVNTFDYNNAAGVRIESDPLHAIQLSPGIKLIGNTKNGWQPYIGVNMVWNLIDDSKVTANDVRLPEMSIKPYVQYGAGIQKRFKDRFLAFAQAMIHNGGRNGVSLTAGLRWKIGKE